MNVYSIKAYGNYGGGMAIVAAENEDDAKKIAGKIKDLIWRTDYASPNEINLMRCSFQGEACVLDHFETGE